MAESAAAHAMDLEPKAVPVSRVAAATGRIEDGLVWSVLAMLDKSPILRTIETWKETKRSGPGGRRETFPMRALLVAMVLCAVTDQPMLATRFTDVLFRQISPTMRHALGVPKPPRTGDLRGQQNCYRNVRTRFHALMSLLDPSATPKNRRLDPDTYDQLFQARRSKLSEEEWVERSERLAWFINEILEMSVKALPRAVRRQWKGSAAVDATVIPAFARPSRRARRKKKGVAPATLRYSSDPDADWYHRDKRDNLESDPDSKLSVWGYEATLVVSGSDDPDQPASVPTLVMGMAPLYKPGAQVGQNAIRALASIAQRGHPAHYLAGDRAYTQSKPEHFQLLARALGYRLVLDYKIDQLGQQGSHAGSVLVDGLWYCPAIPASLVSATIDLRKKTIDKETHAARIEERRRYQIRARSLPDAEGHMRMRCPASNPAPLVRCEQKPRSEGPSPKAKVRITLNHLLRDHPPKICSQESITLPPQIGAKYVQELAHETPEWHATYAMLRNSNEGMNGFIKDGAREAVDDPERRRIRGVAPQSVLVAFQLFAANLRKIDEFVTRAAKRAKKVRRLPSRRTTRSLSEWSPVTPRLPGTAEITSAGDPDPPQPA